MGQNTVRSVPAEGTQGADLAQRLQAKEQERKHTPQRIDAELIEDKAEICLVISKEELLHALAPGTGPHRKQEGVNLAAEGDFTFRVGSHLYSFHLRLAPVWVRVDMVVEKGVA